MHLLQSGIDPTLIALYLGHETIETTHIYVQADLLMKERALEKLAEKCSRLDHQRNGRELPVRSIWAEGNQIGRRDDHLVPV